MISDALTDVEMKGTVNLSASWAVWIDALVGVHPFDV